MATDTPTTTDLPKAYDPASVEAETYKAWLDEKCFHADPDRPGVGYSIVIPPPNVTGALHLGHAINNTLQDILTRVHRMKGFNTVWIPGIDHAGIATQAVVEKQLKEKENKTRHDLGREELVKRIWAWKEQYGNRIVEQLKRLGCSCDWDRTRFTLDEMCARAVRETFFKLFKDGLIYRGKRLVNWDVFLQTSVSDDEIYHETVKTSLWHIRYPIVETNLTTENTEITEKKQKENSSVTSVTSVVNPRPAYMVVATTRPETMLGDTAVAVHSQDPRWNWAIGKAVELPLTGRRIPIIADDILVDPKFGTGVVKVTPAHDPNDYAVWQRHQGQPDQIDLINILTPEGKINEHGGPYTGMKREAARKQMVADLEHAGLLEKEEPYEHQVGHSDRSKTPIEPYLSDQWFVKMAPLAEPALEVVRDGTIKFFPERHAQQYLSWLGEKRDWPISRQLWWGHRIPVWRLTYRLETLIKGSISPGQMFQTLAGRRDDVAAVETKKQDGATDILVCLRQGDAYLENMLKMEGFEQDPNVLDTWFSSALWPHSTLGWPEDTAALRKWYPTSVLLTGRDIITLWVARMVMTGLYNMQEHPSFASKSINRGTGGSPVHSPSAAGTLPEHGRAAHATGMPAIPFYHVVINPTILDGKGERMSKSKGNGVDPVNIIDTHGADALRFTMTQMATETQDARLPVKKLPDGRNTSDKFDAGRNFCNKIWNATRFALQNLAAIPSEEMADRNVRPTEDQSTAGRNVGPTGDQATADKNVRPTEDQSTADRNVGPTGDQATADKNVRPTSDQDGAPNQSKIENRKSKIPSPPQLQIANCKLQIPDKWILSRLMRTIKDIEDSLSTYRFDQYAKTCYDFFWRDLCDWYIEAIKPDLKDTANPMRQAQAADILAACLNVSLRLMHPMIPFITERLWWYLNAIRPERSLAGIAYRGTGYQPVSSSSGTGGSPVRPEHGRAAHATTADPFPPRLILAPWPLYNEQLISDDAESTFSHLQELIAAIRNIRNEYKVDQKKAVTVSISAPDASAAPIRANQSLIELLATCTFRQVQPNLPPPPNSARAMAAGCEVFVENMVDPNADAQRTSKRREELLKQITALKARRANKAYMEKAPPHLVKQTEDQLAAAEAELAKLE